LNIDSIDTGIETSPQYESFAQNTTMASTHKSGFNMVPNRHQDDVLSSEPHLLNGEQNDGNDVNGEKKKKKKKNKNKNKKKNNDGS